MRRLAAIPAVFLWLMLPAVVVAGSAGLHLGMMPVEPLSAQTPLPGFWTYGLLIETMGCRNVELQHVKLPAANADHRALDENGKQVHRFRFGDGILTGDVRGQMHVVMHEAWHCIQAQEGRLRDYGTDLRFTIEREQEADVMAVDIACRWNMDGMGFMRIAWTFLGDPNTPNRTHGSGNERLANAEAKATSCQRDHANQVGW